MKKIVVAVDFSANSKKTIRFAIQLAGQLKAELTFLHIIGTIAPSMDVIIDYSYYASFQEEDTQQKKTQLEKLVRSLYNHRLPQKIKYTCTCELGNEPSSRIIAFAQEKGADFICAGARGNGLLTKLFGSVATHLITTSPIPVFVVPRNYYLKPLKDICYASDMENFDAEMKTVLGLATAIKADLDVLHLDYDVFLKQNREKLDTLAKNYESKGVAFEFRKLNALQPFNHHLSKAVTVLRPSIVVLFTKLNRNWYERLILSSKSAELAFTTKVPLLVYRKTAK